jgi:hypothetical protein
MHAGTITGESRQIYSYLMKITQPNLGFKRYDAIRSGLALFATGAGELCTRGGWVVCMQACACVFELNVPVALHAAVTAVTAALFNQRGF